MPKKKRRAPASERKDRFGYPEDTPVRHRDDEGNQISTSEFMRRVRDKSKKK